MPDMTDPALPPLEPAENDAPAVPIANPAPVATMQYGESPAEPGVYIVFDRPGVMTAAGIAPDQQPDAETLITKMMNWRYKVAGLDANLCYISPGRKMAGEGADYEDNPITQLRYCDKLVSARYGSWTAALQQYKGSGGF